MRQVIGAPGTPLRRAHATSSTATSFTAPAATTTKPSGAGVLDFSASPPSWLALYPFGTGNDDTTFDVRLVGWRLVNTLWVPAILLQFTATLSTAVGVAGSDVLDTDRFADTVGDPTTNFGVENTNCLPYSPQNNTPSFYLVDAAGCTVFRVDIDLTGATGGNALVGAA